MSVADATYRRVALALVLLAAAAPYRYYGSFPIVASVSVLDVALLIAAASLAARRAVVGRLDLGDRRVLALVSVLPILCVASLLWTSDTPATVREALSYGEALLIYVFVVQQTSGLSSQAVMRWLRRWTYALLVPGFLLLLRVPGFAPQAPGIKKSSGDYLSFFTRLSHPYIGRSNNLATLLVVVAVVFAYWAVTRHHTASYIAAGVATVAIALTFSRGAIIALVVALLLVLPRLRRQRSAALRRAAVLVRVILLAIVLASWAFYVLNADTQQFVGARFSLSNVLLREGRFSDGLAWLWRRPFLGYGAGTLPGNDPNIAGGVHNTYLQQLLAYGVVLGVLAIGVLVALVRRFLRSSASGVEVAVGIALLALLFDFGVEASFEGQALRVIIYMLIGMLVGLCRAVEREGAGPTVHSAERAVAGV